MPTLRPDNAPICPDFDEEGRFVFITLRGGGMFVVDSTATPLAIVAEYDRAHIHGNGCGGVHLDGQMYINAGGGTPANPLESDLYSFPLSAFSSTPNPPNTPQPAVIFSHDDRGFVDSHGMALNKKEKYLWVADRAANRIIVVKTDNNTVVNEIDLVGEVSSDPAPDLLERSPDGDLMFMALRGPNPLTANVAGCKQRRRRHPGLGIIKVKSSGKKGAFKAVAPISHVVGRRRAGRPSRRSSPREVKIKKGASDMSRYLFIESRDPFESRDVQFVVETATALKRSGNDVTVFLVQTQAL